MDKIEELEKLAKLLKDGAISQQEFDLLKRNLLSETNESLPSKSEKVNDKATHNGDHKDEISQEEALKLLRKMDIAYSRENLVICSEQGNQNAVELLLIAGSNPNGGYINDEGVRCYALHFAAYMGHIEIIKLLLDKGAKIDLQNEFGETALFFAIENGKIDAVKLLIEKGADVNITTSKGVNSISWAKKYRRYEILDVLKREGAIEPLNNPVASIQNPMSFRRLKLIGIFIGLSLFVGWCATNFTSSTESNSSSSGQYAELHCPWCQGVQKSSDGKGLVYYEWVDGGVSWNQFYDGVKYKCCTEKCCRLFHAASGD
jgi:hypothetical protein